MMCAYRQRPFDLVVGSPSAWTSDRLPGIDALAAGYESAGGASLVDWEGHLALACFKVAVIAAGIDHRRRAGAGAGAGFDTSGEAVGPFLELARESIGAAR
jgi:aminoglycoside phosphotransferase (APT) family kinase protein